MYGSVRSELTRQKSQNSTKTGRPICLSIRSGATLIHVSSRGNGGAGIVSGWARTGGDGSIALRGPLVTLGRRASSLERPRASVLHALEYGRADPRRPRPVRGPVPLRGGRAGQGRGPCSAR